MLNYCNGTVHVVWDAVMEAWVACGHSEIWVEIMLCKISLTWLDLILILICCGCPSSWGRQQAVGLDATLGISTCICDVICKKVPYGETNIIDPDQKPHITHSVWSRPMIFVAHEHLQKAFLSLPVQCLSYILSQTWENSRSRMTLYKTPLRRLSHK